MHTYKICVDIVFSLKSNRDMSRRPFALRWQITIRTNATCITTSLMFANSPQSRRDGRTLLMHAVERE